MGELTNRVSNGPDSFFDGKAVAWNDVATVVGN